MSRTLIVTEFLTLDGVMEAPGGEPTHPHAGWTFQNIEFVPEAYALKGREQEQASALLLGRRTFEAFAPVWPSMEDQFPQYNAMPKYVVSTTLDTGEVEANPWGDCHLLRSIEEVRALTETEGGPIIVHGSGQLARSLAEAGLVDRYHLLVFPVALGAGARLFPADRDAYTRFVIREDEVFSNGVRAMVLDVVRESERSRSSD